ncbi:MAG: DUF192 domain-containing protein [Methanomassiliicoccales archaeon]|nr:MAG: DUF192 domain-containing protein [Methanomassiliicoccales archaeon]
MEKKIIAGLLAGAVIIIVVMIAIYIEYGTQDEENEETLPLAIVSFELQDSSYLNITCEVASTSEERSRGLMYREELPMDRGMLFVYRQTKEVRFTMKNTLIPLDIIFIDDNGKVLNVEEAAVELDTPDSKLTRYNSSGPVAWVLEINQGLCASHQIEEQTSVNIEYLD